MKWKKATEAEFAQFDAALPIDKRVVRAQMFGMKLGKVGDYHFAGRGGQGVMVRVGEKERDALLAKGGALWEPMPGKPRPDLVVLPERVAQDPKLLAQWVRRAFEHCLALPPRAAKRKKKAVGRKPTKRPPTKRGKAKR